MTDNTASLLFGEPVFIALLFAVLAPGVWGIWLLSQHQCVKGIVVPVLWALVFGLLAWFLHYRKRVRLWAALPSALLAMGACVVVLFRHERGVFFKLFLNALSGSQRQFKHLVQHARVTGLGKLCGHGAPSILDSKLKHSGLINEEHMRYAVVMEKAQGNFSAHVPDLPKWVATGATIDEIGLQIREAIEFHLEGMREGGTPITQLASRLPASTDR